MDISEINLALLQIKSNIIGNIRKLLNQKQN